MRIKILMLLMLTMFLVGCATVKTNYVDPTGRKLPDPSYNLQVIGEPLFFTFYYTAYEMVEDVDGSQISTPHFLNFLELQTIDTTKIKALTLTIEVNNPKQLKYTLYEKVELKVGGGNVNWKEIQKGGERNASKLPYRRFVYRLPLGEKVKMVDYMISVHLDDVEVLRIGHFRYQTT